MTIRSTCLSAAVLLMTLMTSGQAWAQNSPLSFLDDARCEAVDMAHDDVVGALIQSSGAWSREVAAAWLAGGLGDLVVAGGTPELARLYGRATVLLTQGPSGPDHNGMTAHYTDSVPPNAVDRVRTYLNGPVDWFQVRCPGNDGDGSGVSKESRWIIGGSSDDASAASLEERGFAKLSFTSDLDADETVVAVDLYIGYRAFGSANGPDAWRPYLSYQRRTGADEVNDLVFGLQYERLGPFGGLYGDLSFETDDAFDSALYRAAVTWRPAWTLGCMSGNDGRRQGFRCTPRFVVDHVSVGDVGGKVSLVDEAEYTRIGGGLEVVGWRALDGGGRLEGRLSYEALIPLDGDEGEAELARFVLDWLPQADGHWAFGVEYVDGEDLTSLTRSSRIMAYIGFRY